MARICIQNKELYPDLTLSYTTSRTLEQFVSATESGDLAPCSIQVRQLEAAGVPAMHPMEFSMYLTAAFFLLLAIVLLLAQTLYKGGDWE